MVARHFVSHFQSLLVYMINCHPAEQGQEEITHTAVLGGGSTDVELEGTVHGG